MTCKHSNNGECPKMEDLIKENKEQWDHLSKKVSHTSLGIYTGIILFAVVTIVGISMNQANEVAAQIDTTQRELTVVIAAVGEKQELKVGELRTTVASMATQISGFQGKTTARIDGLEKIVNKAHP